MPNSETLITLLARARAQVADSVLEFNFNKKRIKILSSVKDVKENSNGIIYWMSREMRVQDNWSFLFAQKLALKNQIPLYVMFFLLPKFLDATPRHFKFLLKGLAEVAEECEELKIPFYLYSGKVEEELPKVVETNNIGGVVCDFSPLRNFKKWISELETNLPTDVVFCQVDGHNIVPCWEASNKAEFAARTIRPKITDKLSTFLTPFPRLITHPYSKDTKLNIKTDTKLWSLYDDAEFPEWVIPGYKGGIATLESFCKERLKIFAKSRNDPNVDASSNLSPWLHFGQISAQRCVLEVTKYKDKYPEGFKSFSEEIIVRRELSDNFCYYNEDYDDFSGCANWAKITLDDHRKDKRTHIYTTEQFEEGKTHDPLWNAAQLELVQNGKMHGFMRMYWCKKILEWTETPEDAISVAILLNDRYSFDGRDPNGYVGVMWSICGIHDHGWGERAVFGKIRFMNFEGCKRKFDIANYIKKWGRREDSLKASTFKSQAAKTTASPKSNPSKTSTTSRKRKAND